MESYRTNVKKEEQEFVLTPSTSKRQSSRPNETTSQNEESITEKKEVRANLNFESERAEEDQTFMDSKTDIVMDRNQRKTLLQQKKQELDDFRSRSRSKGPILSSTSTGVMKNQTDNSRDGRFNQVHLGPLNLSSQQSDNKKPPFISHKKRQTPYFSQEPDSAGEFNLLQALKDQTAKRSKKNISETPIQLSDSVLKHLKNVTGNSCNSSEASFGVNADSRFMLKTNFSVSSTSEQDQVEDDEKWKGSTCQTDKHLINVAGRAAQILLQDDGIKMTQSLRHKIIRYQSDLGANILRKQSQGLSKLNYTFQHMQKKISYDKIRTKWIKVELLGDQAAVLVEKNMKRDFINRWIESLQLKRHLMKLTIKAFEFYKQSQRLQTKLIIYNMRKVLNQEKKWLKRTRK